MTKTERIADARAHLEAWKEADLKVARGQEYRMGTRTLRLVDAPYIQKMITYWQAQLDALEGGRGRRHFHIVPVDL